MKFTALLTSILVAVSLRAQSGVQKLEVQVAGGTFGYEAIPEVQTDTDRCDSSLKPNDFAAEFMRHTSGRLVLVGAGDNFAPYVKSREMQAVVREGARPTAQPKELFAWKDNQWIFQPKTVSDTATVPFDNAGCFLRRAGYDAVVPGMRDFRYGPERLRELERYLSDPAMGPVVRILGTNLLIDSSQADAPDPFATSQSGAGKPATSTTLLDNETVSIETPQSSLPWVGSWRITADGQAIEDACLVMTAGSPASCTGATPLSGQARRRGAVFLRLNGPVTLPPGSSAWVCATLKADAVPANAPRFICSKFTVAMPFFHTPEGITGGYPAPYAISHNGAAAIFGVVDPDLTTSIGLLNLSWVNKGYKTNVKIADPVETLQQALDACELDANCRSLPKIVLAQMPRAHAEQLASHFSNMFSLVVSATDASLQTPDGTFSIDNGRRALVLTPRDQYDTSTGRVVPGVQRVSIEFHPGALSGYRVTTDAATVENAIEPPLPKVQGGTTLTALSGREFGSYNFATMPAAGQLETIALLSMRKECAAEIGLIQHRDLYNAKVFAALRLGPADVQEVADSIFHKGDLLFCGGVTGDVLTKTLDKSAKNDASDKSGLSAPADEHRGLAYLGIHKDTTLGKYVVNGSPIDPNKVYSVAMPDYIAAGDTDYPDLSKVFAGQPFGFPDFRKRVIEISTVVCIHLTERNYCHSPIDPASYFDTLSFKEVRPAKKPGTAGLQPFKSWEAQNLRIWPPTSADPEKKAQQDRGWTWTLARSDFGLKLNTHNLTESDLSRFAGVGDVTQATAKQERDISFDWSFRVTRWGKAADFYLQDDASYADTNTAVAEKGINADYNVVSLTKNQWSQEAGIAFHVYPGARNSTGFRWILATRADTQIADPVIQWALKPSPAAAVAKYSTENGFGYDVVRHIPRSYYAYGKTALRYQALKSWFEGGFTAGEKIHKPVTYEWVGAYSCSLSAGTCGSSLTIDQATTYRDKAFKVASVNTPQQGVYLNFSLQSPQIHAISVTAANQFQYYFDRHTDTQVDTKLYDDLNLSLSVPLFGSLKISPQVDIFKFRSKIDPVNHMGGWNVHGYQTGVALSYCFDRDSGVPLRRSLQYDSCGNSKK